MVALTLLLGSLAPVGATGPHKPKPKPPVDVQILGLNDFHGQLEQLTAVPPPLSSAGRIGSLTSNQCVQPNCIPAGGVEYLATHVRNLEAGHRNSVFVSAGDLIGATPLLSALFHDEPTIEAMNAIGLDYNGVGNHEFDEGIQELLRMQYGRFPGLGYWPARRDGCHPVDKCADGDPYNGAKFRFLAANVTYRSNGLPIFPPFWIHNFSGGARVAFIGMTLEGTPLIVSPNGIASVQFKDEVETANKLVPLIRLLGVEAIVVLLHEGGVVGPNAGNPNTGNADSQTAINTCPADRRGPAVDIAAALHPEIDVVITGHTNWAVNCVVNNKIVTGAAAQGRLITDIDAKIDPKTRDFVPGSFLVNNRIVTQDVAKAADMTALIADYNVVAAPIAGVIVGNTSVSLPRAAAPNGESPLGRLIADAQLASTVATAGGQIAFMNPGGIRADLNPGEITHGEAFGVQPFSNIVTTKTMTGAQIEILLEQQFMNLPFGAPANSSFPAPVGTTARTNLVLAVSAGFTYTWDAAGPLGDKVNPATIMLNGNPVLPGSTYRVTMNNFIATGGDNLPAFTLGTNEVQGLDDLVALEQYLASTIGAPYVPPVDVRITRLN